VLVRQSEASLVLGLRLGLLSAGNGCMQVLRSMSTHLLNQRCIPARLGFGTTRPSYRAMNSAPSGGNFLTGRILWHCTGRI
jgi:hypothetical protein